MCDINNKELKNLTDKQQDLLIVEGIKLFTEAVKSNLKVKSVYIDKVNLTSLSRIFPKYNSYDLSFISNDLLAELYTTAARPEREDLLIAVLERPTWKISDLFSSGKDLVFLEQIQDPGNMGVVIRSSAAFDIGGILISKNSVSPFNSKVVRSSAGAVFHIPIVVVDKTNNFFQLSRKNKYKMIATSASAKDSLIDLSFNNKAVYMFGNEGSGLTKEVLKLSDNVVRIPHKKEIESLNLSVSVSLILWERYRRGKTVDGR